MNDNQTSRLQTVLTALRSGSYRSLTAVPHAGNEGQPARFVTISRQAGAGGKSLGDELVKAINELYPQAEPWSAWDRELVEKVAEEHHIQDEFIENMEDRSHHWFNEFLESLSYADRPSEYKIYRRVAMTTRALAQGGRAVLVGRGGVFITTGLPGGINVRLVAPLESRIQRMAERMHISLESAAVTVREIDRNRLAFYHRYWPTRNVEPETFTLTFNTAEMTTQQMVSSLLPLVIGKTNAVQKKTSEISHEIPELTASSSR